VKLAGRLFWHNELLPFACRSLDSGQRGEHAKECLVFFSASSLAAKGT